MVELPYRIPFGEYFIEITRNKGFYHWSINASLDNECVAFGNNHSIELAASDAFKDLNDLTDYLDDIGEF
ncbi:hypothetical protein [Picosynechococcus sp. PCC 8807]